MKKKRAADWIERLRLSRFDGKRFRAAGVDVVREELLEVVADGSAVVTIACAGIHLRELAVGFLKQEGLIEGPGDIRAMTFRPGRVDIRTREGRGRVLPAAAAKTIGLWPAAFRPMALSKATLACPPVTEAWSRQTTMFRRSGTRDPGYSGPPA